MCLKNLFLWVLFKIIICIFLILFLKNVKETGQVQNFLNFIQRIEILLMHRSRLNLFLTSNQVIIYITSIATPCESQQKYWAKQEKMVFAKCNCTSSHGLRGWSSKVTQHNYIHFSRLKINKHYKRLTTKKIFHS